MFLEILAIVLLILIVLFAAALLIPFHLTLEASKADASIRGSITIRWLGIFLYATGGALRLWPVFVLGSRFSGLVAIQPGHTLETHGIYTHIRNPSYLGMLTMMLGWALAFRAGAGVLLTALLLVPLIARIRAEERLLHAHFCAEYDNYCAHTWRLLPGVY